MLIEAQRQYSYPCPVMVTQPAGCPDAQPVFFCTDLLCVATYAAPSFALSAAAVLLLGRHSFVAELMSHTPSR